MTFPNRTTHCFVEQCNKPTVARGLCTSHYKKRELYGVVKYAHTNILARFWANVNKGEPDECWEWVTSTHNQKYGRMSVDGRSRKATHVSLFLATGMWPTLHVLHACDNPPCVNPAHLSEGTHLKNMREAFERDRMPKNDQRNFAKLSNNEVLEIDRKMRAGETTGQVARQFNVSLQTTWRIKNRITWKELLEANVALI